MVEIDDFHLQTKRSHTSRYRELTPWVVSKKKWDIKEDKYMIRVLSGANLGFQKGGANMGIYNGWFAKKNDNWLKN